MKKIIVAFALFAALACQKVPRDLALAEESESAPQYTQELKPNQEIHSR